MSALTLNTEGNVYNITGGTDYSIKEVADIICKFIPDTLVEYGEARKVDLNRGRLSIDKAREDLGYFPKYTLESGIKEMIDGYR